MSISPHAKLLVRIFKCLPHAEQIDANTIETESGSVAVRFDWRGVRFRVTASNKVEEVQDKMLVGTNLALLLQALLKTTS